METKEGFAAALRAVGAVCGVLRREGWGCERLTGAAIAARQEGAGGGWYGSALHAVAREAGMIASACHGRADRRGDRWHNMARKLRRIECWVSAELRRRQGHPFVVVAEIVKGNS